MASTTAIVVIIAYFFLMISVGAWANRRTKNSKDYLVAGQSLGFFVMAIATYASIQSGYGMIGATGQTYAVGLGGLVAIALFAPIGFVAAWFVLGTRLYSAAQRYEVYSIPDYVRVRYQSPTAQGVMSIAMVVGSIAYMSTQVAAMGTITALLFGVSVQTGAWIGAAIIAAYTVAGGMIAAIWNDLIQGLLMIAVSLLVFFAALSAVDGWGGMVSTITAADPTYLTVSQGAMSGSHVYGLLALALVGGMGQPQLLTKFLMLRSQSELKWGALVATIGYALTTLFIIGTGMALKALSVRGEVAPLTDSDKTTTTFLSEFTNPVVAGLALTALLAAIMSSASSFITVGAAAAVRDLPLAFGRAIARELLWLRVATGVVTVLAVLFVFQLSEAVYILGAIGWAAFAAAVVGPIAIGAYWHRGTGVAVTSSVAVGMVANIAVALLGSFGVLEIHAAKAGPGSIMVGIVVYVLVSVATSTPRTVAQFDQYAEIQSEDLEVERANG